MKDRNQKKKKETLRKQKKKRLGAEKKSKGLSVYEMRTGSYKNQRTRKSSLKLKVQYQNNIQ